MSSHQRSFQTRSAAETISAGSDLGGQLQALTTPPLLLILSGDLGAGKTTFMKGLAEGLSVAAAEEVTSPTFTLVHEYGDSQPAPASPNKTITRLVHLDLYRLEHEAQLLPLGLDEMIGAGNLVVVEWGEKFRGLTARANGTIVISHEGEEARSIAARWQVPGP